MEDGPFRMQQGHSLNEIDENGIACLHDASWIGYLPIVQYLMRLIVKSRSYEHASESAPKEFGTHKSECVNLHA